MVLHETMPSSKPEVRRGLPRAKTLEKPGRPSFAPKRCVAGAYQHPREMGSREGALLGLRTPQAMNEGGTVAYYTYSLPEKDSR